VQTLAEVAEGAAEVVGGAGGELVFEVVVGLAPGGEGAGEEAAAIAGELEDAAAAVGGVGGDFDQAAALERLEGGGEGGAVHGEEVGDGAHGGGLRPVEGHEQRELAIGQAEGAEGDVESAGEGAGGALDVEAEAAVPNEEGSFVGAQLGT
jgi:hypothetical protein